MIDIGTVGLNEGHIIGEPNRILNTTARKNNIDQFYVHVLPTLVDNGRTLISKLGTMHATFLAGADFTRLENVSQRARSEEERKLIQALVPGTIRRANTTRLLGYDTVMKGTSHFDGKSFEILIPVPEDVMLPEIMDKFNDAYKRLIEQTSSKPDLAIKTAAFLSHMLVVIHPFYEGNGRVARGLFTLALLEQKQPGLIVEKEDREVRSYTLDRSANFLKDMYDQFSDCLPDYILKRIQEGKKVNVDELLGIPTYVKGNIIEDKRKSVGKLIHKILDTADISLIDQVISDEELQFYKKLRST